MGRGNNKRSWQGGDRRRYRNDRDRFEEKDTGPPPEAYTRAYEAQLTDRPDEEELIRWAGEGQEMWLDRWVCMFTAATHTQLADTQT